MKHLLFLILIVTAANAYGQCDQFDNLLKKGDGFLKGKKPNYQEAINAYTAAILACSDRAGEAQKRIGKMVNDINRLKDDALMAKRKATEAEKDTKKVLADLEIQKSHTDSALLKAEKLINAFYFYDGRFALAYGKIIVENRFYFIDKNGNKVKQLGEYDKAEQFDETGFAKVRDGGKDYLLDTFGTTYPVAYTLAGLNESITALDLRGIHLDIFPAEILLHPQLEVLILDGEYGEENTITLPSGIEKLPRLKSLQLSFCQLDNLPSEIGQLENLQSLYLFGNKLIILPAEIGQLKNLQSLVLAENQLSSLPSEIGQMKKLHSLDLSTNQLSSLPSELGQLNNLQYLDLTRNQLSSLPSELGQLKNLQWLILFDNQLNGLPSELGQLKNLQSLGLTGNQLSSLPSELGQLKNLRWLVLAENRLDRIPSEIGQLKNLQWLVLAENQLSNLPLEIGQLKNLQELNLFNNHLSKLPDQIGNLENLQRLDLYGNDSLSIDLISKVFSQFPKLVIVSTNQHMKNDDKDKLLIKISKQKCLSAEIGQLKNLQSLYLPYNQLSSLPVEIGKLNDLQEIDLYGNDDLSIVSVCEAFSGFLKPIALSTYEYASNRDKNKLLIKISKQKSFPTEIGKLKNLQSLDLSYNQLDTFPAEVGQLKNLQSLDLSSNQLSSLPAEIGRLKSLQMLDLSSNQLSSLPTEIRSLKSLKELYLYGNSFPPDYIGQLRKDMPWCLIGF